MVAPPIEGIGLFKIANRSIDASTLDKRKTTTSNTAERWAMRETIWKVVGGEHK